MSRKRSVPILVHVNSHKLRAGDDCVVVRRGRYGRAKVVAEVVIRDRGGNEVARVGRLGPKLKCGARVWIQVADGATVTAEEKPACASTA